MDNNKNKWPKAITVDKRIVRILSSSTYSNFPSAIREIITNSYDADAEIVNVDFDFNNSIITITDDGKGMSEDDFSFYLRIAGKSRKKEETTTRNKRKIVGQFGVGFLSVLPFCDKYLIETTKRGSTEIVSATITSTEYFKDDFSSIDVDRIPITGGVKIDPSKINESYTRIRLLGFSKLTKAFLNREYVLKSKRNTIKNLSPLDLIKWELQEYLPINYDSDIPIGKELNELSKDYSLKRFQVFFNNEELYREIYAYKILDISKETVQLGNIRFKYFISTNYNPISPIEARHLLIRNLNVGVGERTTFGIGMDGKVYARLAHLTGEILIEEGVNDLISVSRDKFNYSTDFEQLKEFFREKLRRLANELDSISAVETTFEQFQDDTKITDLSNLKEEFISDRIKKLKERGYQIKENIASNLIENASSDILRYPQMQIDKFKRTIYINDDDFIKNIIVGNSKFRLKLESWDYMNSEFPALQFEEYETVLVNENYPLFKDKNKIDTFIKLNILLLVSLKKGEINSSAYSSLMKNILITFNS